MEPKRMKPEGALASHWMTMVLLVYLLCVVPSLVPFVVDLIVDADMPGGLISAVLVASWTVIVIPFAVWVPAYVRTLEYGVTGDSVRMRGGVFWKKNVTVPFTKITNIDLTQGPLQRRFGIGTIHVQTAGAGGSQGGAAELLIFGIKDTGELKELITERMRGSESGRTAGPAPAGAPRGERELLEAMLGELRSIRGALERER